jgi:hypothetical protein
MSDEIENSERKTDHLGRDLVKVTVNNHEILMPKIELTGFEIKELAIAENVPIKIDFVLFEDFPNGKQESIPDGKRVAIHAHQRFEAIDNDDHS